MHACIQGAYLPQFHRMKTDEQGFWAPSSIAQKHISERENGTYPVSKALELLETASQLGFGKMEDHITPVNSRRVKRFRKYCMSDLIPSAKLS